MEATPEQIQAAVDHSYFAIQFALEEKNFPPAGTPEHNELLLWIEKGAVSSSLFNLKSITNQYQTDCTTVFEPTEERARCILSSLTSQLQSTSGRA